MGLSKIFEIFLTGDKKLMRSSMPMGGAPPPTNPFAAAKGN